MASRFSIHAIDFLPGKFGTNEKLIFHKIIELPDDKQLQIWHINKMFISADHVAVLKCSDVSEKVVHTLQQL